MRCVFLEVTHNFAIKSNKPYLQEENILIGNKSLNNYLEVHGHNANRELQIFLIVLVFKIKSVLGSR